MTLSTGLPVNQASKVISHKSIMRKIIFALTALGVLAGCTPQSGIEQRLTSFVESGKYMFGHQDDLMYGYDWNANTEADRSFTKSDVFTATGEYPAVLGLDLGGIELGDSCNLNGNDFALMREAAQKHYRRGGIVTLSWHARNPLTGGDAWDVSSDTAVESVLPGGEMNERFTGWLDAVGDYISSLGIPVIFRPWHEHTGSWFWWGAGLCTPDQYNELWYMTHDYLTEEKGLADIVWAISPNASSSEFEAWEDRYPGDAYVDIIGLDCYSTKAKNDSLWVTANEEFIAEMRYCLNAIERMGREHGKMIAVTETGLESQAYPSWWTEVLQPAIDGFPIAYVLAWRNANKEDNPGHYYVPVSDGPAADDFRKFAESEQTVFLPKKKI